VLLTASTACLFFPGSWPCILDMVLRGKIWCQLNDPNQRFHRLRYGPLPHEGGRVRNQNQILLWSSIISRWGTRTTRSGMYYWYNVSAVPGADKYDSFPRDRQWVRKTKGTTCAQKITSCWDTNPWTTVMNRRHEVFLTVPRDYALLCKNNDSTLGKSAG